MFLVISSSKSTYYVIMNQKWEVPQFLILKGVQPWMTLNYATFLCMTVWMALLIMQIFYFSMFWSINTVSYFEFPGVRVFANKDVCQISASFINKDLKYWMALLKSIIFVIRPNFIYPAIL